MTLADMILAVQDDTQLQNVGSVIGYLNSAQDWVTNRILTQNENVLKVSDDQMTLSATTSTYDLAGNVSTGVLYQLKWLGLKLAGDTKFEPVRYVDSSDDEFVWNDQETATATGHPVLCAVENFNQVRFAPPLASGVVIRADYIYRPAALALDGQTESQLPEPLHEALVEKGKSMAWRAIDEMERSAACAGEALDRLYSAQNVLDNRQYQQPPRTRPFSRSVSRWR